MVEPILRFRLVSRGFVLLHCAAIDAERGAIIMSAQTDTGKTSTVLRLLMQRSWGFISDDMAILTPDAEILSYPKPMTLSSHTMSAVNDQALPRADRFMLAIRSRVHSKSGRSAGHALGRLNVPIVTINAWVQLIVPPPKYHVQSLIDCDMTDRAPIDSIVLMERGTPPLAEEPDFALTIDRLLENTDDAYTFPPFAAFAPLVAFGELDYDALRIARAPAARGVGRPGVARPDAGRRPQLVRADPEPRRGAPGPAAAGRDGSGGARGGQCDRDRGRRCRGARRGRSPSLTEPGADRALERSGSPGRRGIIGRMSLATDPLSRAAIRAALGSIDPVFRGTAQFVHDELSARAGRPVVVKIETANPIRSFKGRGTWQAIGGLVGEGSLGPDRPLVVASTGNFGQGAAYAGRAFGAAGHRVRRRAGEPGQARPDPRPSGRP